MSVGGRAAPVAGDYPVCRDLFADDDRRLRRAWQLAYDPESNLASRTENGAATAYAYDNLYHLAGADAPGSAQDELWTYDLLGNRLTDLRRGGTQAWQYNADNQLLQSYNRLGQPVTYVYDAAGNLLRKQNPLAGAASLENRQFVYDVSGRLSQVLDGNGALVADYRYDPFGRRISKSVYRDLQGEELAQPQSRWFVYAAEGLVAETTGAAQYENFYGWQPNGLWGTSPVFVRHFDENGWGENYWYLVDHLGTPRQLVDSAGAIVWVSSADAFGAPGFSEANAFDNRLGFAGQYFDAETGSFYNYFRNYDPASGRYLQRDPIGIRGGINTYVYVASNPMSYVDPWGMARFGFRPLEGDKNKVYDPNDPPDGKINHHIAHEQLWFDDFPNDNVGFFSGDGDGVGPAICGEAGVVRSDIGHSRSEYDFKGPVYDDRLMRQALTNIRADWDGKPYCIGGVNCQHFADALRKEYERLSANPPRCRMTSRGTRCR